jgi:predicted nucleic acid-binding protein
VTVVVDTNVIAYYLLRTEPFAREAREFWSARHTIRAPASWEAELANVVWMAVRARVMDRDAAIDKLRLADALGIRSESVRDLWEGALARAVSSNHPAYDTVFVELAIRLRAPLATFDEGLIAKFPEVAKRPRDLGLPP